MLKLENTSYSYNKQPFVNCINVAFPRNKITAIIGPNGSGKSTILKLCTRLLTPQTGKIYLEDVDITKIKNKDFARKVAVLFQTNHPPHVTVRNYVMSGRYPYQSLLSQASDEDHHMVAQAMRMTGCDVFQNRLVDQLSGGERQRVFITMALAQNSDLIFLDEPTTFLDISTAYDIMELVATLKRDLGKTIVMVLHDLNMALNYADDIVLIEKGKIVAQKDVSTMSKGNEIDMVFNITTKRFSDTSKNYYFFDKMESISD